MDLFVDNFDRVSNLDDPHLKRIFQRPRGHWYCGLRKQLSKSVQRFIKRTGDSIPVIVLYFIPNRDLGNHSRGGAKDDAEYLQFVSEFCDGLKDKHCFIILEPDALTHALASHDEKLTTSRIDLFNSALTTIKQKCKNARVYIDVGHPRWIPAKDVSNCLKSIYNFDGVSINVSNFVPLVECVAYGHAIGAHFVIDTSRNGNNVLTSEDGWCNPSNRRVGKSPQLFNKGLLDAYLWIKIPGESDGKCNGGPRAGQFWPEYARELLKNEC